MTKFQYTDKELQDIIDNLQMSAYWTTSGHQTLRKLSIKAKFPVLNKIRIKEIKIGYEQKFAVSGFISGLSRAKYFSLPNTERAAFYILGYICYYGRQGDLTWVSSQNGWNEEYRDTVWRNYTNPALIAKIDAAINQAIGQGPAQARVKKAQNRKLEVSESTKMKRLRKLFENHDFEEEQVLNLLKECQIQRIQNE